MSACRNCGAAFTARAWQVASHDYMCTPCRRENKAAYRAKRKADGNPVVSGRGSRDYHRAYAQKLKGNEEYKARRREQARVRRNDPLEIGKALARRRVRSAIVSGAISRHPCEVCNATPADAHHDDYSRPLDVRWLCRIHHREHHAKATGQTNMSHEMGDK